MRFRGLLHLFPLRTPGRALYAAYFSARAAPSAMDVTDDELALRFWLYGTSLIGTDEGVLPNDPQATPADVFARSLRIWASGNLPSHAFTLPGLTVEQRRDARLVLERCTLPPAMQIAELERRRVLPAYSLDAFRGKCGDVLPAQPPSAKRARR